MTTAHKDELDKYLTLPQIENNGEWWVLWRECSCVVIACTCGYSLLTGIVVPPAIYICIPRAPMCRLDRVTSYVCDILISLCAQQGLYQLVSKSRQALARPISSHNSAIPRRSSHFGTVERLFSAVGFAFANRRRQASAETLANLLAFDKLNLKFAFTMTAEAHK